jgi:hypothetical protein
MKLKKPRFAAGLFINDKLFDDYPLFGSDNLNFRNPCQTLGGFGKV